MARQSAEDTLMHAEAVEAAATVERQIAGNEEIVASLGDRLREDPPAFVVTCARGSSDHAATFAKYAIETRLGLITASASPSVVSVYRAKPKLDNALYLAISQSGRSPDLVQSARAAREAGARVVALVNADDSPLAEVADTVVPLRAGPERSVAATKSYLGTLAAIVHVIAHWTNDAALLDAFKTLPATLQDAQQQDWTRLVEGLANAANLFVLGRGIGLGIAQEAALKCKETSGLHAEAYSAAEVKHGPMALVGPEFPVLLLGQEDATLDGSLETARTFRERGARVFVAAPEDSHADTLPTVRASHPLCEPLAAIQSFYLAVNALAVARGHDPDLPPHLNKVTETV